VVFRVANANEARTAPRSSAAPRRSTPGRVELANPTQPATKFCVMSRSLRPALALPGTTLVAGATEPSSRLSRVEGQGLGRTAIRPGSALGQVLANLTPTWYHLSGSMGQLKYAGTTIES
jgi:hypothetical protein